MNETRIQCGRCRKWFFTNSKQKGMRPVVVIHAPAVDDNTKEESMVVAIPMTSSEQDSEPGTVIIPADQQTQLPKPGQALVYQLTVYDKIQFFKENKKGSVGDKEWGEIQEKLKNLLHVNDKAVALPDGQILHVAKIQEILKEHGDLKKENQRLCEDGKELQRLKYKIEEDKKNHLKYKEDHKNDLQKKDKQIQNLQAELDALKVKHQQALSQTTTLNN